MALPWLDIWCAPASSDDHHAEPRRRSTVAPLHTREAEPSRTRLTLPDDLTPRLRAREESAYRELIRITSTRLVIFAASIVRSRDVAEDVVQNVFVRIWNLGDTFVPRGSLADYLFTAVRNGALTALRSDSRARRGISAFHAKTTPNSSSNEEDSDDELAQTLATLRAAVDALTEHQRAAVALRYGEGMSIAQVARVLEISEKGAEQLLVRIRKVIRARLSESIGK